jgi:hypothetical protein
MPVNLFDGNTAYNPPWVGFLNVNPTITLFFGSIVSIKALRLYLQGNGAGNIYIPASIIINGNSYSIVDTGRSGWYEFTGAWTSSTLTVKLNQNSRSSSISTWIFLGEIIVVASYDASLAPTPSPTPNPTVTSATGKMLYIVFRHLQFLVIVNYCQITIIIIIIKNNITIINITTSLCHRQLPARLRVHPMCNRVHHSSDGCY